MPTKKTRKSFVYFIYVSMSPTFYDQLFQTKVFQAAFLYLQFVFVVLKQISLKGDINYWINHKVPIFYE